MKMKWQILAYVLVQRMDVLHRSQLLYDDGPYDFSPTVWPLRREGGRFYEGSKENNVSCRVGPKGKNTLNSQ